MIHNIVKYISISLLIFSCLSADYKRRISHWQQMTLEEKVAQMIMVRVSGQYYQSDNYYKKKVDNLIKEYDIGGLITFGYAYHIKSFPFMLAKFTGSLLYTSDAADE